MCTIWLLASIAVAGCADECGSGGDLVSAMLTDAPNYVTAKRQILASCSDYVTFHEGACGGVRWIRGQWLLAHAMATFDASTGALISTRHLGDVGEEDVCGELPSCVPGFPYAGPPLPSETDVCAAGCDTPIDASAIQTWSLEAARAAAKAGCGSFGAGHEYSCEGGTIITTKQEKRRWFFDAQGTLLAMAEESESTDGQPCSLRVTGDRKLNLCQLPVGYGFAAVSKEGFDQVALCSP